MPRFAPFVSKTIAALACALRSAALAGACGGDSAVHVGVIHHAGVGDGGPDARPDGGPTDGGPDAGPDRGTTFAVHAAVTGLTRPGPGLPDNGRGNPPP